MANDLNSDISNINFLDKCRFYFAIDKLPNTNYFIQSANIPGISMSAIKVPTPYSDYPVSGDKLEFSDFSISFKPDEDLKNWEELYTWMIGMVRVDDFNARKVLENSNPIPGKSGVFSNAMLLILNSNYRPFLRVSYSDIFPIGVSSIDFDSRNTDFMIQDVNVSFAYRRYEITRI